MSWKRIDPGYAPVKLGPEPQTVRLEPDSPDPHDLERAVIVESIPRHGAVDPVQDERTLSGGLRRDLRSVAARAHLGNVQTDG